MIGEQNLSNPTRKELAATTAKVNKGMFAAMLRPVVICLSLLAVAACGGSDDAVSAESMPAVTEPPTTAPDAVEAEPQTTTAATAIETTEPEPADTTTTTEVVVAEGADSSEDAVNEWYEGTTERDLSRMWAIVDPDVRAGVIRSSWDACIAKQFEEVGVGGDVSIDFDETETYTEDGAVFSTGTGTAEYQGQKITQPLTFEVVEREGGWFIIRNVNPNNDESCFDTAAPMEEPMAEPAEEEGTSPADVESLLYFSDTSADAFPQGTDGEVSVVAVLDPQSRESGLVVFRNGTDQTINSVEVSAIGRDAAGTLVATGDSQGSAEPALIGPGQIGIAYVYTGADELPSDVTFEYDVADFSTDTTFMGNVSLAFVEVVPSSGKVLGIVENQTSETVSGPISVLVLCFDEQDSIVGYAQAYADRDDLRSGSTSTFDARILRSESCERFIAGASGYDF